MPKQHTVSEQACLKVLRAIATERIESKYMTYHILSSRSTCSLNYTLRVISELKKRGWITVNPSKRIGWKEITITEAGRNTGKG